MTIRLNRFGETIVEIMLTMVIILLAVTAAFQLITMAFLQNALTENKIIATNLAREGMEAVRYIRDYNWLYYGSKRRICWNHLQDNGPAGTPDGELTAADAECAESPGNGFATYQMGTGGATAGTMEYVLKQTGTHWYLTRKGFHDTILITNGNWASINKDNLGVSANGTEGSASTDAVKSFRICRDENDELFVSCLNTVSPKPNATTPFRTPFVRYVKIEYIADPTSTTKNPIIDPTDGAKQNMMKVTVGVKWLEQNTVQDVELMTWLTDFYQRAPGEIN